MDDLRNYLNTTYKKGGRGPVEYDCWGLVRAVRSEVFGRPLLPSITQEASGSIRDKLRGRDSIHSCHPLIEVNPHPGAIAEAYMARFCVHVGVVVEADGRLMILETDTPSGPCLSSIPMFRSRYTKVEFYD